MVHRDRRVTIDGNGFCGIARWEPLRLLELFCDDAGVRLCHETEARPENLGDFDLVAGADGLNSSVQAAGRDIFRPNVGALTNWFIWNGTEQVFDKLTLTFRDNGDGHFVAHHYRYSPGMSTFIFERDAPTYAEAGF